jgi:hypothetical protein
MDTPRPDPEVVCDAVAAILRKKTEAERLAIAFRMWDFARDTLLCAVRSEHPEWQDQRVKREVAKRISHGAVADVATSR